MFRLNTKIAFLVVLDCCFFKIVYKHGAHLRGENCATASRPSFPLSLTPAVYCVCYNCRSQDTEDVSGSR